MTKTKEKSASYITLRVVGGSSSVGLLFREFQNLLEEDKRSASRGDSREKMTNADQRNDGDLSWEVTNTRVVPIKNSVMMNIWDDIQQFKFRKTIGMARRILLYNSLQLVVTNKRLNRGELLVEVQDKLMYAEENTMRNMREPYMMAVTCPMGGHQNIL